MKMTAKRGILLIACALIAMATFVWAQEPMAKLEGWKPYTPTRLQWFAVELNAGLRVDLSSESGYSMDFIPIEKEDRILIYVKYLPNVNREVMNMAINTAREVISIKAKSYEWSSWLKVKEQVQIAKVK